MNQSQAANQNINMDRCKRCGFGQLAIAHKIAQNHNACNGQLCWRSVPEKFVIIEFIVIRNEVCYCVIKPNIPDETMTKQDTHQLIDIQTYPR